jgi:hypothetical protein
LCNNEVEQYLINSVTFSRNKHENTAAYRGTSNVYATGTLIIANNQTGYLFVNIAPLFWKALHLRPYSIDGQLLIRLQFDTAVANISSYSMTTTEAILRLSGYEEPEGQKKLILSKAMLPKNFFYYSFLKSINLLALSLPIINYTINSYNNLIYFTESN